MVLHKNTKFCLGFSYYSHEIQCVLLGFLDDLEYIFLIYLTQITLRSVDTSVFSPPLLRHPSTKSIVSQMIKQSPPVSNLSSL